ncbi:isopenicillin N synthase family dioxygenase [Legionella waltersii]|uniref:Oxidoreductase, 2OG-Fe(II) oxygenase family n=1 Tax=Legionella waltersii TaxID=66969 RepID=A0A0W1AMJ6_9GAMM|nr:2OG-Fe(II) oxygenase family protein [Legionella waltersii]KTD82573.1 oxidoreductase, 2OG-Fe(II) oxygenase family [Legionella waltersii]SNV02477.1 flavanone 3-dioxygenase [Legionella waltersii]
MIKFENQIPVIDVSSLAEAKSIDELRTLARRVYEVYSNIGFAYIVNHGISQSLFDRIFEQSRLFHHLPEEEKMKIVQNEFFRGYMPFATSTLKVSTLGKAVKPNQSAAFILMHDVDQADPDYIKGINLAGPNQWPSEELLPDFKPTLLHYREEMTVLLKNLIRLFALSLNQNYYAFDQYFYKPTNYLRLQYYAPQPDIIPEEQYGIAPHTDYGFLTLLTQDNVGGLQVLCQDTGNWIDVPPLEGGVIVNTGDMLRRVSDDTIISTPHRVINTSGRERYSIPFFFEPNMHSMISPLNLLKQPGRAPHPTIEYADYIMERIQGNYDIGAKKEENLTR